MYGCNDNATLTTCTQRGYRQLYVDWYQNSEDKVCSSAITLSSAPDQQVYTEQAYNDQQFQPQYQGSSAVAPESAQPPTVTQECGQGPQYGVGPSQEPILSQGKRTRTSSWTSKLSFGKRRQSDLAPADSDPVIGKCYTCSNEVRESQRGLQLYRDIEVPGKRKSRTKREKAYFDEAACQEEALSTPGSLWTDGIRTAPPVNPMAYLGAFAQSPMTHEGETYEMNLARRIPTDESVAQDLSALPGS